MLRHVVLGKLGESSRTGYELCSLLERETGRRPSYGSIYPLLERMAVDGDVVVKQDGRRKRYTLTAKGKRTAKAASEQRTSFVDEEMVRIKKLMALMEMDPRPMLTMLERARKGEPPLGRITASMFALRDTAFAMAADGRAERNAVEINKILTETTRRLARMR